MAKLVYLDTHAIAWLYANELEKFSMDTLLLIEENQVVISPMVLLELTYLYENGIKIRADWVRQRGKP